MLWCLTHQTLDLSESIGSIEMEKKSMAVETFSFWMNLTKKSNIKLQSKHLKEDMDADLLVISQ